MDFRVIPMTKGGEFRYFATSEEAKDHLDTCGPGALIEERVEEGWGMVESNPGTPEFDQLAPDEPEPEPEEPTPESEDAS